jgi:hypothetical protein
MGVIDVSGLTFSAEQVRSLSEAIIEKYFTKPDLTTFHTLIPGIEYKKKIAILGVLGLTGKKSNGDCTTDINPGTIGTSEKEWSPEYITDRFAQCWEDGLKDSFFVYGLKAGIEAPDLTNTDFANFLEDRLGDAMYEGVLRHAWFGDTDAANYSSSPAGTVTDGIDVDYFNAIDGFWKQIFAIAVANTDQKVDIAANAEATYADQKFDSTDTTNEVATVAFQALIDNADERLTEAGDAIIICTKSLADQYKRERKKASGIDLAYTRVEKGIQMLEIDGVKVYAFSFWDRMIKAYFNNGTKYYLPHRAIYTNKESLQIGTKEQSAMAKLDPFYDKVTKKYYVDYGYNLDVKIPEDYKVMAAY